MEESRSESMNEISIPPLRIHKKVPRLTVMHFIVCNCFHWKSAKKNWNTLPLKIAFSMIDAQCSTVCKENTKNLNKGAKPGYCKHNLTHRMTPWYTHDKHKCSICTLFAMLHGNMLWFNGNCKVSPSFKFIINPSFGSLFAKHARPVWISFMQFIATFSQYFS